MRRRIFAIGAPLVLLGAAGYHIGWRRREPTVQDVRRPVEQLAARLGTKLYAPDYLPKGARPGPLPPRRGVRRVMQCFMTEDGLPLCILAQQPRSDVADRYHERLFVQSAEATTEIGETKGYLVTGSAGERRLFWEIDNSALILSSQQLPDSEMVAIARSVR